MIPNLKGRLRVIVESPYAGDVEANVAFARKCMRYCLDAGWFPLASHLLYTQCLDDNDPTQRTLGIYAGFAWRDVADLTVFFTARGWSQGMLLAKRHCDENGLPFIVLDWAL